MLGQQAEVVWKGQDSFLPDGLAKHSQGVHGHKFIAPRVKNQREQVVVALRMVDKVDPSVTVPLGLLHLGHPFMKPSNVAKRSRQRQEGCVDHQNQLLPHLAVPPAHAMHLVEDDVADARRPFHILGREKQDVQTRWNSDEDLAVEDVLAVIAREHPDKMVVSHVVLAVPRPDFRIDLVDQRLGWSHEDHHAAVTAAETLLHHVERNEGLARGCWGDDQR
eukprot:202584-Rhodomonas_salina.1